MRAKSTCDKALRYFLLQYFTSSNYCNWIELMCFHSSLISLLYLFYGEWNLISFLLPSYASCVSCPLWLLTLPADDCVWIRLYLEPLGLEITKGLFIWARLTGLARLPGWILPWVHMRNFSPVSEMRKGQRSWVRVLAPNLGNKANIAKHKNFNFRAYLSIGNS